MANYERDKDDARVYDGSEDDEDGEGSHLPVVIIIAILVLAAFGGVVWLAYNQGVARGRNEPVRVASAESTDPGNGGQIKVYQQPAGSEDEDDNAQAAPAKPANAPPAQAVTRTDVPPQQATPPQQAVTQTPPPKAEAQTPAPKIAQTPPPAPKPAQVAQVAPKPTQVAQVAPKPQTAAPTAKPPVQAMDAKPAVATKPPAPLGLARPASEAPKPLATTQSKPVVAAAPPKPTAAKPVAGGSVLLQIGAYKSEAEAMTAWKTYSAKHSALLAGFSPDVQKADLGDKGTWYRLRIASFPDKDGATALCDRLKAQNGACFLAH